VLQLWIVKGERSSLMTRIAAMESASLCVQTKNLRRFWNSNLRSVLAASLLDKAGEVFFKLGVITALFVWFTLLGNSACCFL
jgi:hypothetical protein